MDENVEQGGQEEEVDRRQGLADQRTNPVDRRAGADRRSGWDRRRGPGRRRTDERRSAEEGEMNDEQFEFIMAIEEYKRVNHKPFPSYTEILEIAKALGYRRVADPQALNSKQDE
jgi:hypothetical protein